MKNKLLTTSSDWTFDLIEQAWPIIDKLGKNYGWEGYKPQFEVITSEQMLDAYSSVGMPVYYNHWSFGKHFIQDQKKYEAGQMGLAYEIVINSNPSICYLMEDNTSCMQLLVMSHAAVGHSHFFKNNYLFKQWTNANSIIDYMIFAKKYIEECEFKYGSEIVELTLDCAHSLRNFGIDKYERGGGNSLKKEKEKQEAREQYYRETYCDIFDKTKPVSSLRLDILKEIKETLKNLSNNFEPEENILYFLEKNSPILEPWQREILRIVRKTSQYFYPQMQTKLMNEGFASFCHYTLMTDMYDQGYISEGFYLEFLKSHTGVVAQPDFDSKYYSGINVYALGFAMFKDIKRICENPTEEDKRWFPDIAGSNWVETINYAVENYKDESFILQFLSPKIVRDFKLFALENEASKDYVKITAIQDDENFKYIRDKLSQQYNVNNLIPHIEIVNCDLNSKERTLVVRHFADDDNYLEQDEAHTVVQMINYLWGYGIYFESIDSDDSTKEVIDYLGDVIWRNIS